MHWDLGRFRVRRGWVWRGTHYGHIFRKLNYNRRTTEFVVICRGLRNFYWRVIDDFRVVWGRRTTNVVVICLSLRGGLWTCLSRGRLTLRGGLWTCLGRGRLTTHRGVLG